MSKSTCMILGNFKVTISLEWHMNPKNETIKIFHGNYKLLA
jgi:hypothetical protein